MMVVLVSTREEGLTIFPTHRIAQRVGGVERHADRASPATSLPGVVLYRGGGATSSLEGDGLDVEIVDRLAPEGVTYTPRREEAEAAVDGGDAEARLPAPPGARSRTCSTIARRGEVMPQKIDVLLPEADQRPALVSA